MKLFIRVVVLSCMTIGVSGCGAFSATTLRCGTDGDASYVEVVSAPQAIASNVRALGELCGFAYEKSE